MHVIKATEWDILCYLFTLFPKSTLHYCLLIHRQRYSSNFSNEPQSGALFDQSSSQAV